MVAGGGGEESGNFRVVVKGARGGAQGPELLDDDE